MPMQQLAMFFLAAAAVGGIAWVFLYPLLSGERQAEKRMESVSKTDRVAAKTGSRAAPPKLRRDSQLENTLKELEARRKKQKNPPLSVRIEQAGLSWSKNQFMSRPETSLTRFLKSTEVGW